MPAAGRRAEQHRGDLSELTATSEPTGPYGGCALPAAWKATSVRATGRPRRRTSRTKPTEPKLSMPSGRPTVDYGTGYIPAEDTWSHARR